MKAYKISCQSDCGSYFQAYLKSVTVVAENREEALAVLHTWLKKEGWAFIYPQNKWEIQELADISLPFVIDWDVGSDY
jgi:hypothetical protein